MYKPLVVVAAKNTILLCIPPCPQLFNAFQGASLIKFSDTSLTINNSIKYLEYLEKIVNKKYVFYVSYNRSSPRA